MSIPYLQILAMLAFAMFFCRAAESENESTWVWCGLSLLISAVTIFWWHWGWLGIFSGQLALFVGVTLFRMWQKK